MVAELGRQWCLGSKLQSSECLNSFPGDLTPLGPTGPAMLLVQIQAMQQLGPSFPQESPSLKSDFKVLGED